MRRHCLTLVAACVGTVLLSACGWVAGVEEREAFPDPSTDLVAEAGADVQDAPSEADSREMWGSPEQCNLLDDDLDGVVDDGFDWGLSSWQKVASTTGAESLRITRLADGTTMVLIAEHVEPGLTRLLMGSVLPDGTPSTHALTEVAAPRVMAGFGVTRTIDDEVGVAYVEGDADSCAVACPMRLIRYRQGALVESTTLSFPYPEAGVVQVRRLLDFAATSAGYSFLMEDSEGTAWLHWKDQVFFSYGWKGPLPGIKPESGSLGVGPAVGWLLGGVTDGEQQTAMVGIVTPGGYSHILKPSEVTQTGGGTWLSARSGGRAVAWVGNEVYFGVTLRPLQELTPRVFRIDSLGISRGNVTLAPAGELHSVVEYRGGLIASFQDGESVGIQRADSSPGLRGKAVRFTDALDHALVTDGRDPLVVRLSQDGSSVWVARLGCEL